MVTACSMKRLFFNSDDISIGIQAFYFCLFLLFVSFFFFGEKQQFLLTITYKLLGRYRFAWEKESVIQLLTNGLLLIHNTTEKNVKKKVKKMRKNVKKCIFAIVLIMNTLQCLINGPVRLIISDFFPGGTSLFGRVRFLIFILVQRSIKIYVYFPI